MTVKVLFILLKIRCSMRGHYVRDVVPQGKLKVCKINTNDNPADMMTKHVPVSKFELCSSLVGITV